MEWFISGDIMVKIFYYMSWVLLVLNSLMMLVCLGNPVLKPMAGTFLFSAVCSLVGVFVHGKRLDD